MIAAQGKVALTKQSLSDRVFNEMADALLNRMDAQLILECFEETLASVPVSVRARASNGLIKAFVAALFDKATYRYPKRAQLDLLRRIFICRKTR